MTQTTRRIFLAGAGSAVLLTAACNNGVGSRGSDAIDAQVDTTLNFLYGKYPGTKSLGDKAAGILVMPLITKAGFGIGGSYGRGALRVGGATVDYYSAASATFGLQVGAQQYSHVLFFMTPEALAGFRSSYGWAAGGDIEYVVKDNAGNISADSTTSTAPVLAVIFGQAGLAVGATLEGTKYTRIIP
jgi:lipid-binding SYLF domain-containing protein